MIEFQNPQLLYLLLLVPLIAALYFYARHTRRSRMRRFGHPEVLAHLMPDASKYMPGVKLTVELIVIALLALVAARPYSTSRTSGSSDNTTETKASGMEIMICVDVSNSMLASSTDKPDGISRIQRARLLLEKLINRLEDDKIGLIVFAGDAYVQLPLTSDFISAKMFLNNIDPGMVPTQGTAIGSAIDMAMNCFDNESEFPKAIIVLTDGENFEDDATAAARNAARQGIRVDVIGLGTETAVPIPIGPGQYLSYNGEIAMTALNAEEAAKIAKEGDGIYVSGNAPDAVDAIINNLSDITRVGYTRIAHSPADEQFPVIAWAALILLVIDVFIVTRKISWLRSYNFFTKGQENNSKTTAK